jgi:hypothetical protein
MREPLIDRLDSRLFFRKLSLTKQHERSVVAGLALVVQ